MVPRKITIQSMPRFHLHIHDGEITIPDLEGGEYESEAAARKQVQLIMSELARLRLGALGIAVELVDASSGRTEEFTFEAVGG